MATSGSVNFALNRNELIRSAYEIVGVSADGEPLGDDLISVAAKALNVMIKAFMAHGLHVWKRDKLTLPLVASQASYTIGREGSPDLTADRPLRVLTANRVGNGTVDTTRVELIRLAKSEYEELPDHATSGIPSQFFFDPTLGNSTIYFWPVPDSTTATNDGVELVVQAPLEDMDNGTDDFDFPAEWQEAIVYGLANRLAPRVGLDIQERYILRKEAAETLQIAKDFDVEDGSVYFQPDMDTM